MTKAWRAAPVLAACLTVSALAFFYGCGGSSDKAETASEVERASEVKRPPEVEQAPEAEPPSSHEPPSSNGDRTGAGPLFHQTEYDLETGWTQDVSDRHAGRYLKSVWHDPASAAYKLWISSQPSRNSAPPLAAAELSRTKAQQVRNYREMSFKKVKIGQPAVPAVRFVYSAGGEDYIEYFFAQCGTSIAL